MFFRKKAVSGSSVKTDEVIKTGAVDEEIVEPKSVGDILQIVSTAEAEHFVGDLFRRKFGGNPPDYPQHFVAMYSQDGRRWTPVGYVNFWRRKNAFMCGGMVIEDRAYKKMPALHRELVKSEGGIAEHMLKQSFKMLPENDVIWGYVGDTKAERVDLRVGFVPTHIEKIFACWNRDFTEEEKRALTDEVSIVGVF